MVFGLENQSETSDEKADPKLGNAKIEIEEKVSEDAQNAFTVTKKNGEALQRATRETQPVTGRWELVAYALYYFANNSSGPYAYTPTAFQNLLNQGGWDANLPGKQKCSDSTTKCVIEFGSVRNVNSVVLLSQGIGFALQTVVFIFLGAFADYGSWGSWILISLSFLSWGVQFGFLGVHEGSKYKAAFALSILSSLGYQGCQSFWTAVFPRLARNLSKVRQAEDRMLNNEISEDEYHKIDAHYRNKITNYSWAVSNIGMVIVYAASIGILFKMNSRGSEENNNWGISIVIMFATVFWIVFGVPWFFLEKKRVNQKLPEGATYLNIGWKQLVYCFKSFKKLKQTGLYIFSYWLLGDGLNTSCNIQSIIQNEVVSYDMISVSYLNLLNSGTSIIGMWLYWWFQKKFNLSTKTMFLINSFFITFFPLYGLIGTWTNKIGFHNLWEVYAYNAYSGLFISSYYAYSSTMMSEVCPRGKEFVFFAIFSTVNKTSSFIGPFITSAIISRTDNNNTGFSFVLGLCVISTFCTFFISESKSREECEEFLLQEDEKIKNGTDSIF